MFRHSFRPTNLSKDSKKIENAQLIKQMDEKFELIEDPRFRRDFVSIESIFDTAKIFKSREDCSSHKRPKARFFCNYKLERSSTLKFRLAPVREKSHERLEKLVLKRVPSDCQLNSPHGKWTVSLNRITENTIDNTLSSIENISQHTPKRGAAFENETPKKKQRSATKARINYNDNKDVDDDFSPVKRIRQSMIKCENSTPSTPTTSGILARRKSILKTPTTSKPATPRRSIQFSSVIQEHKYEKTAKSKIESDDLAEDLNGLAIARKRLHVSAVPTSLPCREKEYTEIYSFLEGNLLDEVGGCIYVSGVPGTGKTATTTEVIRALKAEVAKDNLPAFDFVEINGMRITEPRKAYVEINRQLTGKTLSWEQAYNLLDKRFTTPSPHRKSTILIVDELDILCNKRQDVVYNLLNWPNLNAARLIVVTIANTMDLPERVFMGKVSSRLGLTRLTFQPYSHKQLQEIVASRLSGLDAFSSDAIQLVARKVAALSGDARRALDIARRASEIAESEADSKKASVTMAHVQRAVSEMISCTKVLAIKGCSTMEKHFLQAVCVEVERTGIEEVMFRGVFAQLKSIVALNGHREPTVGIALDIATRLSACRLLICEHPRKDIFMKILLNISPDDFYYATQLRGDNQE